MKRTLDVDGLIYSPHINDVLGQTAQILQAVFWPQISPVFQISTDRVNMGHILYEGVSNLRYCILKYMVIVMLLIGQSNMQSSQLENELG